MTYPQMRLDAAALDHNIEAMAAWCADRGVELAPHVKTTMSAPIVARQMAAGAAAITVATVQQCEIVFAWGHRRVLIANEVVDVHALARLRALLERHQDARIACFVDSPAGVAIAGEVFSAARQLSVLLDVGTPGGRSGVRDAGEAHELAHRIHDHPVLRLVGVAGYEGVAGNDRDPATLTAVDEHCRRVGDVFLANAGLYECDRPVLSMGGSVFPDRVVLALPDPGRIPGRVVLLRSGCYVTHDHGVYAEAGPPLGLTAAATVRAQVLSTPEPGVAVVGAGKRELPHDAGMPILLGHPGTVSAMYDHHTVLTGTSGLRVSDVAEFGISHPCSLFARWDEFEVTLDGRRIATWTTEFRAQPHSTRLPDG